MDSEHSVSAGSSLARSTKMWQPQAKKHRWEAPAAAAAAGGGRANGEDAKLEQGGARGRAALGRSRCAGQAAACGCGRDK